MYSFSIITPVYKRHQEISELLQSISLQDYKNFEVIIVDNSPDDSLSSIILPYQRHIKLSYRFHKGLGVSESRNLGVKYATGDYVVFIDSDCILPPSYLNTVNDFLEVNPVDAYGGPDRAHESFTPMQKAVSYAMTSFFTTGGIRGRKQHIGSYHPRSFNMGLRRDLFNEIRGFRGMKVSEDIDLSLRIYKAGKKIALIGEAFVYHKRRATFDKFFRQVYAFGYGRYSLGKLHGEAVKPVHMMPSAFVIFLAAGLPALAFSPVLFRIWAFLLLAYSLLVLTDSTIRNRNVKAGFLSVAATMVMLTGYGLGMLKAAIRSVGLKEFDSENS